MTEINPERDATIKGQDSLTDSKNNPRTFTEAQHTKAVEDAIARYGDRITRERIDPIAKELESYKARDAEFATLRAEKVAWQKAQEEAEEEALSGDPSAVKVLRENRRRQAELDAKASSIAKREEEVTRSKEEISKSKAEHETDLAELRVIRRTQLAAEVAMKIGVSMDAILKLAKADTREAYEEVASVLPQTKERQALTLDSGQSRGGGGRTPSIEELRASSPEATERKVKAGEWIIPAWRS